MLLEGLYLTTLALTLNSTVSPFYHFAISCFNLTRPPFNIILTSTNPSRVNAFRRLLVFKINHDVYNEAPQTTTSARKMSSKGNQEDEKFHRKKIKKDVMPHVILSYTQSSKPTSNYENIFTQLINK